MTASIPLNDVIDHVRQHYTSHYNRFLRTKDSETQEAWIDRLKLGGLFGDARLSNKEWDIMCTGGQTVNNYYNNPKRRRTVSEREIRQPPRYGSLSSIPHSLKAYAGFRKRVCMESGPSHSTTGRQDVDLTKGVKGVSLPVEAHDIVWVGDRGTKLKTCAPTVLRNGTNILQQEEEHVKLIASRYGFVEGPNEYLVVVNPHDSDVLRTIRFHLSQNRCVLVTPEYSPHTCPVPYTADLRAILAEQNFKENRRIQAHSMLFASSFNDGAEKTIKMTVKDFVDHVEDPQDSLFMLGVPINKSGSIPPMYSSLDDLETGIVNADPTLYPVENHRLTDTAWGSVHHPATFTPWHHDSDGKVSAIVPKLGVKLWSAYIPSKSLSPSEVEEVIVRLCETKLEAPEKHEGTVITIMLKPGDLLFQPAGLVYQAYAPTISYSQGSSFWMYESLHLTRFSRLLDAKYDRSTTKVVHKDLLTTLTSMVRLALFLPLASDLVHYKRAVVSLYDMIGNRTDYISDHMFSDHSDKDKAKKEIIAEMNRVPYLTLAMEILEKLISSDFALALGKTKVKTCAAYLEKTSQQWFMPGESAKINFEVLCSVINQESKA
ncbi:hypothetical protein VKT23_007804 [Stygiomarasmius scandens]|uniref:JmjC domain-containing protein n=1 Tax=Marasmiellus scandens TaxID=2682957 RepID=A0ABR1JPL5_9AGAR